MTGLGGLFPRVSVQRGGITFPRPGTPEWEAAEARRQVVTSYQAMVHRYVGSVLAAQGAVLDRVCLEALHEDWDVLVHRRPYYGVTDAPWAVRFVGIALIPRTTGRVFPTIIERSDHADDWEWDDD